MMVTCQRLSPLSIHSSLCHIPYTSYYVLIAAIAYGFREFESSKLEPGCSTASRTHGPGRYKVMFDKASLLRCCNGF